MIASLFFFYEFAIRTFLGTLVDQIVPALSITTTQFALLGTIYYIFFGLMQIPVGSMTDRYGVKLPMFIGMFICAIGVLLFAHSTNFSSALSARIVMGIGSSFAFVCLLAVAASWFSPNYFATICGLSQFLGTLGPALASGPLIHHMLSSHQSWRTMMTSIALAGFILSIIILIVIRRGPFLPHKIASKLPFISILKQLFSNNQLIWVSAYSALNYCSLSILAEMWGTRFLESRHLPQGTADHIISIGWFSYAFGCLILGWISDHLKNRKKPMMWASIIGFVAASLFVYVPTHQMIFFMIMFGLIGFAAAGQNIGFATITEHTLPALKASALGMNNGAITLGNITLPIMIGMILSSIGANHIETMTSSQMMIGLSISPLIFLLSIIIVVFLMKEPPKSI